MSLRRSGLLALALLLAAACAKSVSQSAPAATVYLAAFDPTTGTVPLPSDLALQAAPGQPPGVQREVLFTYIGQGGWPGDQTLTIPIRTITFDAATNAYLPSSKPPPGIDATTVTSQTVAIVRVSDSPPTVLTPEFLGYGPDSVNPAIGVIRVRPKEGLTVGRYAVALRGGSAGVKTTDGLTINADQAIALVAPNKDLSNPENQPPGGLSAAQATQLEQLRKTFANGLTWGQPPDPATRLQTCLTALGIPSAALLPEGTCWLPLAPSSTTTAAFAGVDLVFPHGDVASIQTFNVAGPAVVADTSTGVIPFPSDFMLDPTTGKVRNLPALGPAAPGLATLDGFSTTGLMLVPLSGPINASTIPAGVSLWDLSSGIRRMVFLGGPGTPPEYVLQPPALVQGGASTAIGMQPAVPAQVGNSVVPLPPLKPKTTYLVLVTNAVTDTAGNHLVRGTLANLLLTVETPLSENGHSNIPGVSDADAAGLQHLRDELRTVLIPASGVPIDNVAMAYTITTQDVRTISGSLTALPYKVDAVQGLRTSTAADIDVTAPPYNIPAAATPSVKKFVTTTVATLDLLDPANGALNAELLGMLALDPSEWNMTALGAARHAVPALVAIPKLDPGCVATSPCLAPLVVFHHGIFGSRFQMLPLANDLAAKGFVVAAIDAPFHGDRAFCTQNSDCNGGTCTLAPANQAAPGTCTGGNGLAFDSARLTTVASGNYFISTNFFRARDVVREDLFDQSSLVLSVARPPGGTPEPLATELLAQGVVVDPTKVYFAGVSLGGMIGMSAVATNPRISRAAFNVAGGTLVDIFTNAPAFASEVAALFAELIPGFTPSKVTPGSPDYDPAIAQQYAQALIVAKWILDPAEQLNYAAVVKTKTAADPTLLATLTGVGLAASSASVYGQFTQDDQVVPNPFSLELYDNAIIPTTFYTADPGVIPLSARHGALYSPTAGAKERGDLAGFLENPGVTPPSTETLP